MAIPRKGQVAFALVTAFVVAVVLGVTRLAPVAKAAQGATSIVYATGLESPRGLRFGPDGDLYVAEAGLGGTMSTTPADCQQVPAPVGPYTGGFTARISRIDSTGVRTDVVTGLPSSQSSPANGGSAGGVADVDFIGGTMYALLSGGGCSHGLLNTVNGIIRVGGGSWELVADLSAWQMAHPVAHPEPDDFEPDGTWYSMVAVRDSLYAVDPNHGDIVRVSEDGAITRVVDVSATQGHIVPTAITYRGNFFVGNLSTFPIQPGASEIFKLTPSGHLKEWAAGLNTVLGVRFDERGRLYAIENTVGAPFPTPGLGRLVRIDPSGRQTVLLEGLNFPTGMTFGPDGKLYVSEWGFGPPLGRVLQVTLPAD